MFGDGYRIDVFNPSFSSRFFNNLSSVKKGQTNLKPNVLRLCKLREVGRFFLFFIKPGKNDNNIEWFFGRNLFLKCYYSFEIFPFYLHHTGFKLQLKYCILCGLSAIDEGWLLSILRLIKGNYNNRVSNQTSLAPPLI
jgi:hypothetical protein